MSSSKALALEESNLKKLKKKVEAAVSSTIYEIYPTVFPAHTYTNWLAGIAVLILNFAQIIPFFIHGYGYSSVTTTVGRYARYLQLQIELTHFDSFMPAFWASVVVIFLIAINAGLVIRSNLKNDIPYPLTLSFLFYSFNIGLRVLFPAMFKLLATPWWCNPATQKLFPFEKFGEHIDCWGSTNIIYLIIGTISALVLIGLTILSTFAYVNTIPVPLDLFVTVTPIYNIAFYSIIIFMTINEFLIGQIIGTWWEALLNWIAITILPSVLIYYLPYHNRISNGLNSAILFALWWATSVTFVAVSNKETMWWDKVLISAPNNPSVILKVIDFVLFFGIIPSGAIGYLISQYRYLIFQALATGLCQEVEEDFQSKELYRAKFSTQKNEEQIEGARRNPYLYLPRVLQKYEATPSTIEIVGRCLWHSTSDKVNVEAAYRLYRMADSAYPDIALIRILRASCFMTLSSDSSAFIDMLQSALLLDTTYFLRFLVEKRIIDSKRIVIATGENKLSSGSASSFGDFQKYYAEAQKYNTSAITSIRNFWSLFLNPEIKISEFLEASQEIDAATTKALATYKALIVRFPQQLYILSSYAYFLELVMKNGEEALRYHRRADQLRAREHDDAGLTEGGMDNRAVISINEEGTIEQVNKATTTLFGWLRSELITRNIKLLVPSPYRERHDQFLDRYKSTGNAKVIGHPPRALFGLHRLGYGFPLMLSLQEKRKENGERIFVGTLIAAPVNNDEGQIVISEDGTIIMISKGIENMFGYKANEVFRANITLYMLDAYAANHESYLRRYKETGEARVIGTAGRNLPGRRKDGSVVPVSLTVTEEYVGADRFYSAIIRDTTHLVATIFIDGFGIIQNTDSGVASLLGYRREDVLGMNIKSIMPPPYNMFHDMYLERYRRTKVSNILRSLDGRNLPAIHADGSIVQIKAIIQKSDTGNDENLLFKGLIRRMDTIALTGKVSRLGFENESMIQLKKDGTIISVDISVLKMLGFLSDADPDAYQNQPIETLIPPVDGVDRQDKNYWMPLALSNTDLNFYIMMVTRNFQLLPVTFSLAMKSSEVILMRLRDLSTTDAVISIDDMGTILAFNEDAYLLLGHDSEEVVGKNIKGIMEESISVQHDGFLQRYRDTRVARVVGIPRVITTVHRDGSSFPIEIQVTELQNADGNTFVGRLRHVAIDNRPDRELIQSFFTSQKSDNEANLFKVESLSVSSASNGKLLQSQALLDSGGDPKEEEASQSSDDSSSSSDESEEEAKIDQSLIRSLDSKLTYLKNTTKVDPINRKISITVIFTLGVYIISFIIALIVFSSLPKPGPYIEFSDRLLDQGRDIYDAIYFIDALLLEQISDQVLEKMTKNHISQYYWPCTFGEEYEFNELNEANTATGSKVRLETCAFVAKTDFNEKLGEISKKLEETQSWITAFYPTIRRKDDIFDTKYVENFEYYELLGLNKMVSQKSPNWADFVSSKIMDAISKLSHNHNFDELEPQLDFMFISKNSKIIDSHIKSLQAFLLGQILANRYLELIIHLIFAIILFVFPAIFVPLFILPALQQLQNERLNLVKLMLLVPKSLVWDFVYVTYKEKEEGDDAELDGAENQSMTAAQKLALSKAKQRKMKTDDVVDVVDDNKRKAVMMISILLFSISIPVIAHCAWRFTDNSSAAEALGRYNDILSLYNSFSSIREESIGIFIPSQVAPDIFAPYWKDILHAGEQIAEISDETYYEFKRLTDDYASDVEFARILYNPNKLEDIYSSCQDAMITIHPKEGTDFHYESAKVYQVPAVASRCNDSYHTEEHTPPELSLPRDYALHATRGISLLMNYLSSNLWELAETKGVHENIVEGPIDFEKFQVLEEIVSSEGTDALIAIKSLVHDQIAAQIANAESAMIATYLIGLFYTLILGFWYFRPLLRDFAAEIRHNRALFAMVPLETLAASQPIVDYIERVYGELSEL